ncbi:MAG: phosphodiester glycosidase family protein, partial [Candidatus Cloacimonadota bacterium]|nr:phosphodiester glycosidase family protein [Candidatus Cloacimonadota bacterium]
KLETKIIDFIQDTDELSRSLELPNQAKLHLQYRKNKFIGIKVEYQKDPHTKIIEHYVDNGLNGFDLTQDKYEREINGIFSSLPEEEQILEISFMNYLVHFYNYLINPEGELPHISTNDKALRYPYDIPEAGVINWREIEQGLEFTFIDVLFQNELVERIALTRIDPEYYALKTYNDYDKIVTKHGKQFKHYGRKTIEEWQDYLDANVVVNGSFYRTKPYGKATAQMLENGKRKGSKLYPTGGTILFEPQDRKAPYLKVVDHLDNMQNLEDYGYNYGTNGYPAFYDSNGDSRSKKSYYKWRATRTFIGVDDTGKVLMGNTQEGFFALWRIGHFLQKLENVLNLKGEGYILNMDGGPPACIAVKTEDSSFQYNWYGYTEGNNTKEIVWNVKNKKKWRIPSVVAAIRREEGEN